MSLLESSMPWGDTREMGGVRDIGMDGGGGSIDDKDRGHKGHQGWGTESWG